MVTGSADDRGRHDRIAGALLAMATGDALGAGYEFQRPARGEVDMIGGGLGDFAPGEWTDDTSMAICIAEVTATGVVDAAAIGDRFLEWARSDPADIGISTKAVVGAAASGAELPAAAADYLERHPRGGAGNGALMRTAPIALAHLGDDAAIAVSAREVAELTHADPRAGDSCVLWCIAIDRAIRERRLDGIRDGLRMLPADRRPYWTEAIDAAERLPPGTFVENGFTVTALQAAYAAVVQTAVPEDDPAGHLPRALDRAVRIGNDTDTVAAIAGALLGARWGALAVPDRWRSMLHGWPGLRADDLVALAVATADREAVGSAAGGADRGPDTGADLDEAGLSERAADALADVITGSRRGGQLVLLEGQAGTARTAAAERLARELGVDLFRIDLDRVVSRYIGETEKNLSRVLAAAEASGAVLLFDEADALFGSRSQVRDPHDRYANVDAAWMIERLGEHPGVTIMAAEHVEVPEPIEEAADAVISVGRRRRRPSSAG